MQAALPLRDGRAAVFSTGVAEVVGRVLERSEDATVLLEVGGVGYLVTVTPRTLAELEPSSGAFLYVHHHIREDAQTLYGFAAREERTTFNVLIATHGVGPSVAMAILATASTAGAPSGGSLCPCSAP